jgi:hypothetical protein
MVIQQMLLPRIGYATSRITLRAALIARSRRSLLARGPIIASRFGSSENLSRSNAHAVQVFNIDGLIDPHARVISWRRGTVRVGNIAQFCA